MYDAFIDLLGLIIAIPAAYLAYSYQKRLDFIGALNDLYSKILLAVNEAMQWANNKSAQTQERYLNTLLDLSCAIDEFRFVFKDLKEENMGRTDFIAYEELKDIYKEFSKAPNCHDQIDALEDSVLEKWRSIRTFFLKEIDRPNFKEFQNT